MEAGGEEYTYIPCLNDTDAHIKFLSGRIRQELSGWIL
jgi:ferrochelatase